MKMSSKTVFVSCGCRLEAWFVVRVVPSETNTKEGIDRLNKLRSKCK